MKLNITDASKVVGKPRSTLYRHIKNGTLTVEESGDGSRVIDVSELQRVYGNFELVDTSYETSQNVVKGRINTFDSVAEVQLLKQELDFIKRERDAERERRVKAEGEVDRLFGILELQSRQLPNPIIDPVAGSYFPIDNEDLSSPHLPEDGRGSLDQRDSQEQIDDDLTGVSSSKVKKKIPWWGRLFRDQS